MSVTLPPQDVTDGVVRLRVILFHLGTIKVTGAKGRDVPLTAESVRAKTGEAVDGVKLEQDLSWLNHSPFRQATAVFSPGASLGDTNLAIDVVEQKHWQVFSGWANSGSASTGYDRYLVGGQIGDLVRQGSLLSFEETASDDVWRKGDNPFSDYRHLRYLSNSLVFALPIAPRQDLTLVANVVQTQSRVQAFDILTSTEELSLVYRTALSNFSTLPGDVSVGVEAKGQARDTLFGAVSVTKAPVTAFQGLLAWNTSWFANGVRETFSTTARYSPGGQGGRNSDNAFAVSSNGRVLTDQYAYLQLNYTGDYPFVLGTRFITEVNSQFSSRPLLTTEQIAIGGSQAIRGYAYDDRSFDNGVLIQNKVRLPGISGPTNLRGQPEVIAPYLFADAGYGWNNGPTPGQKAISVGLGTDYQLGAHVTAGATAAWALKTASFTRDGHFKLLGHVNLAF